MRAAWLVALAATLAPYGSPRADEGTAQEPPPGPIGGLPTVFGRPDGETMAPRYQEGREGPPQVLPPVGDGPAGLTVPQLASGCRITVGGKAVVDSPHCIFGSSARGFTVVGLNPDGKDSYKVRVVANGDGTGTGYLGDGPDGGERDLGRLSVKGRCWANGDGTVSLCIR